MIQIVHRATGEVQNVQSMTGYGDDWIQRGPSLPSSDPARSYVLVSGKWVEDIAKVREQLLAEIKVEAENRKMSFLSAGGAKKAEYAQKAAEVSFYDSLGGNVTAILAALALLSPAQRQAKFGYSLADAAAFNEPTITGAIERFRLGMSGANKVPAIAATEAKACAAIKAATTVTAARAVAAAINWPA